MRGPPLAAPVTDPPLALSPSHPSEQRKRPSDFFVHRFYPQLWKA